MAVFVPIIAGVAVVAGGAAVAKSAYGRVVKAAFDADVEPRTKADALSHPVSLVFEVYRPGTTGAVREVASAIRETFAEEDAANAELVDDIVFDEGLVVSSVTCDEVFQAAN